MDVDADNDVEIDARLPALSQSLDLAFPLALIFGLTGHRSAAAASVSLDVPVNVDTGLVFVEANVCVSKLVRLLKEAAELSCPCTGAREAHVCPGSAFTFARPDPSSRPNLMYKSDCDDFLVFEDNGLTQPPSSSVKMEGLTSRFKIRNANRIFTQSTQMVLNSASASCCRFENSIRQKQKLLKYVKTDTLLLLYNSLLARTEDISRLKNNANASSMYGNE